MFLYAVTSFVKHQNAATAGLEKDAAVRAFADAYYNFASTHKGLYRLIMSMPSAEDERAKETALPLLNGKHSIEKPPPHWKR